MTYYGGTPAYIVTYDLKAPNRDYTGLFEAIKKSSKWWHYLQSTWIIQTSETPRQVWERLHPHVDKNDYLLIIEVRDNVEGWLPKEAWDWIHANVPK
jgi:hypothetical protein